MVIYEYWKKGVIERAKNNFMLLYAWKSGILWHYGNVGENLFFTNGRLCVRILIKSIIFRTREEDILY